MCATGICFLLCIICDTSRFPTVAPRLPHGCYPAAVSAFPDNTSHAVFDPEEHFTSGRAEDSIRFHKKIHNANFFVKTKKEYHAAAGKSGFHLVKRLVQTRTA